jgi:hypothetical protein
MDHVGWSGRTCCGRRRVGNTATNVWWVVRMDALRQAFQSPAGQATAQDVANLADGGVRSMVYELDVL